MYQNPTCLPTTLNPPIVGKVLPLFGEGAGKVGSKSGLSSCSHSNSGHLCARTFNSETTCQVRAITS